MFTPLERLLAFRYLRSRRSEGFISVIAWFSFAGITLGVATLIIVMSVMNGFRAELVNRILGLNGHLGISSTLANGIDDYKTLTSYIAQNPNIMAATPQIESQVLVSANHVTIGAVVRGVIWSDLAIRVPLWDSITDEIITRFRDNKAILIGKTMARNLNLAQGDSITLLALKGRTTAFGSIPTRQSFIIGGIFDVGMHEYDSSFVFMPLPAAQKFFSMPDRVSGIELYINDPDDAPIVKAEMTSILPEKTAVFDWMDRNRNFLNALQVERNVMFLILTLIILVAAFNIISMMVMVVTDKKSDIAILRTMGMSPNRIVKIFFYQAISIGLIGIFIGVILGLLLASNIEGVISAIESILGFQFFPTDVFYITRFPSIINASDVFNVAIGSFALILLAAIYPARRAGKLQISDVLRHE